MADLMNITTADLEGGGKIWVADEILHDGTGATALGMTMGHRNVPIFRFTRADRAKVARLLAVGATDRGPMVG